jgi:undecaprenyl-phosphate galactose phosphotransferase
MTKAPNDQDLPGLRRPLLSGYTGVFLLLADVAALAASAILANLIHYWLVVEPTDGAFTEIWNIRGGDTRLLVFTALEFFAVAWFWQAGHYTKRRPFWDEVAQTTRILAVLAAADAIMLYLLKVPFSRFWFLATWASAIASLPILRAMTKDIMISYGIWQKPTLVIGTGQNAIETTKALRGEPMLGLEPIALVAHTAKQPNPKPSNPEPSPLEPPLPILDMHQLERILAESPRPVPVFVALDDYNNAADSGFIQTLRRLSRDILIVPPLSGFPLYGAEVHHLFRQELFFLTLRNNLGDRSTRAVKRTFDLISAGLLLVLLSPVFLYLMIRIRADGGPAFFAHSRIGAGGASFPCYKFRTMVPDAGEVLARMLRDDPEVRREWDETHKLKQDPRITPIGRYLRASSLDELPQLWNVLRGDMSMVGPRPIVEAELERYGEDAFYYLEARPGITGVWQVSGRSDTDYDFRVYLDSWYVKNWSLWYDVVILIKTVRVVLGRAGAY